MGMNNMDNYMEQMAVLCENNDSINKNLYSEYGVKRGLRDENGQGVLTGNTVMVKSVHVMENCHTEDTI